MVIRLSLLVVALAAGDALASEPTVLNFRSRDGVVALRIDMHDKGVVYALNVPDAQGVATIHDGEASLTETVAEDVEMHGSHYVDDGECALGFTLSDDRESVLVTQDACEWLVTRGDPMALHRVP